MMSELRTFGSPFERTPSVTDYSKPVEAEEDFGTLPTSNVLKNVLEAGSWIAVRPSGTEPKIKINYSIKGSDRAEAEEKFTKIQSAIKKLLGL